MCLNLGEAEEKNKELRNVEKGFHPAAFVRKVSLQKKGRKKHKRRKHHQHL